MSSQTELAEDGEADFVQFVFLFRSSTRDRNDDADERLRQFAGVDLHQLAHESDRVHALHFIVQVDVERSGKESLVDVKNISMNVWFNKPGNEVIDVQFDQGINVRVAITKVSQRPEAGRSHLLRFMYETESKTAEIK